MVVRGRVVSSGVQNGKAVSRIELTGTTEAEVRAMFLEEPPKAFFPGASDYFRRRTADGGQEFLENPLGGPPVMHNRISPTADGITGRFGGVVKGEAPVSIRSEGDTVVIEETGTRAQPNLAALPPVALAERVPIFGRLAKGMRQVAEGVMGTPMAAIHAWKVSSNDAEAMVATLNRRQAERGHSQASLRSLDPSAVPSRGRG